MRSKIRLAALFVSLLALVLVGACARRPDLRVPTASAPAPAPAPAPQASQPAPPPPAVAAPAPAPAPVVAAAPAPPPAAPKEFAPNPALRPIHFDFDKSNIRSGDAEILDEKDLAPVVAQPSGVRLEGHADGRGTREYNIALGERRATSTKNYLVSRGVASDRISIVSYGEERPLWSQNRRAMFLTKDR
jgi:peptidoglycan-associated lipoprotein